MRLVALIVDCVIVSAGSYLVAVELAQWLNTGSSSQEPLNSW